MSKRILWHSNVPWAGSGYGVQTALFTERIRDHGYDLAISATWGLGGSPQSWRGIPVFAEDRQFGNVTLPRLAHHWGGDQDCLVITLFDVWPFESDQFAELNIASWV